MNVASSSLPHSSDISSSPEVINTPDVGDGPSADDVHNQTLATPAVFGSADDSNSDIPLETNWVDLQNLEIARADAVYDSNLSNDWANQLGGHVFNTSHADFTQKQATGALVPGRDAASNMLIEKIYCNWSGGSDIGSLGIDIGK